jgi:hypothetical protein
VPGSAGRRQSRCSTSRPANEHPAYLAKYTERSDHGRPATDRSGYAALENLPGILLAGGLDAQDAAWAADILAAQVTYAAIEAELRRTDLRALAAEITANFARLPADDFPLITAHAAQLVAGDAGERFRFAIDVVIDGVLGRASRR